MRVWGRDWKRERNEEAMAAVSVENSLWLVLFMYILLVMFIMFIFSLVHCSGVGRTRTEAVELR